MLAKIGSEYEDLHGRVSASWKWASVHEQMQFVLVRYSVSAPEKRAAGELLKHLEAFTADERGCVKTLTQFDFA